MKEYGIIGKSLTHSFSPQYFNNKFLNNGIDAHFEAFELNNIDEIKSLLNAQERSGICVTIPYKKSVIPYLDALDHSAEKIGAVNCIQMHKGALIGFNTDIIGFVQSINPLIQSHHKSALVLGNGGASKAVQAGLEQMEIPFVIVSRTAETGNVCYSNLNENIIKGHAIIINTTPLGMYPKLDAFPDIPYDFIGGDHLLFDLIYNPEETQFLKKGKAKGASIKNGMEMLALQAEANWQIWNE